MKYIRTYEMRYKLNKKTVDYNKVYAFANDDEVFLVGKIIENPGDGFRDVGCLMIGYNKETGKEEARLVKYGTWRYIREATPEEEEEYFSLKNANKYNL
jgi:hypothetical protein